MSEDVHRSAISATAQRTPIKEVVEPLERAGTAPLRPPYRIEDIHADAIPILPALVDVVQKGLTGPEVKDGGEEEAINTLGRWQRRKELGGMAAVGGGRDGETPSAVVGAAPLHHKQGGDAGLRGRRGI